MVIAEKTVPVAGIPFKISSMNEAASDIVALAQSREPTAVRLANAYSVAAAYADERYLHLLQSCGTNYPDGVPVVWFMKRGRRLIDRKAQRVRGPSLFLEVLNIGRAASLRHTFVGTTSETLDRMLHRAREQFPGLSVGEWYAPEFSSEASELVDAIVANIDTDKCDLIWVALGTPKQDFVASELAERTGLPCIAVGAAFDFLAGTVSEAPEFVQRSGLEWLFRLTQDPKRLWRRYTVGSLVFLYHASRYRLRRNR